MKKILSYSLICLSIIIIQSCSSSGGSGSTSGGNSSGSGNCRWTLSFDNNQYQKQWQGTYPATGTNDGQSIYSANNGANPNGIMSLASPTVSGVRAQIISIQTGTVNTGNFTMNENSYNQTTTIGNTFNFTLNGSDLYSSQFPGSNITVSISSLSPNSVLSTGGFVNAGYVSGTFNGTIVGLNINGGGYTQPKSISGTFNSIRLQ